MTCQGATPQGPPTAGPIARPLWHRLAPLILWAGLAIGVRAVGLASSMPSENRARAAHGGAALVLLSAWGLTQNARTCGVLEAQEVARG